MEGESGYTCEQHALSSKPLRINAPRGAVGSKHDGLRGQL